MAQLESFLLKGRPFPEWSLINQVAFLTELRTRMLTGSHDTAKISGTLVISVEETETPFTAMGERERHSYKGDLTGRDEGGVILSMVAGPDNRTCLSNATLHPVYFVFATPAFPVKEVDSCLDLMESYVKVLAPSARIERRVL
jgi:DNA/RNA-binding domain of Phe-tRNA-synthetase-like protein